MEVTGSGLGAGSLYLVQSRNWRQQDAKNRLRSFSLLLFALDGKFPRVMILKR
jgi:hypothetical protein